LGEGRDPRAVPPLLSALRDTATPVRESAIDALKRIGSREAIAPLVEALRESNASIRWRMAQTLKSLGWQPKSEEENATFLVALGELERAAMLGKAAVKPLAELLKESAYPKRVAAVDLLGEIGDPSTVPPLLTALNDSDPFLRRAAANALGHMGRTETVGPLISTLKDPDPKVRGAAANSLGMLADHRAVQSLIQLLRDGRWEVRVEATEALGLLKSRRRLGHCWVACVMRTKKCARRPLAPWENSGIPAAWRHS
jgi:HEAT repeat protein